MHLKSTFIFAPGCLSDFSHIKFSEKQRHFRTLGSAFYNNRYLVLKLFGIKYHADDKIE
jgi:hypothetical protein